MVTVMDTKFPDGMMDDIRNFFKYVHPKLTPGQDIYHEVFDRPLFFPLQRKEELRRMIQIARKIKPKVIMEIGADKGGGLYHWFQSIPTTQLVIPCEVRGVPYSGEFRKAFPKILHVPIEHSSYSQDAVTITKNVLGGTRIDVLFIDGNKLEMVRDFDTYLPMMNTPSIVFMHDVTDNEPQASFETIRNRGYRTEVIWNTLESFEALQRERKGIPPKNAHEAWLRHWKGKSCGVGVIYIEK